MQKGKRLTPDTPPDNLIDFPEDVNGLTRLRQKVEDFADHDMFQAEREDPEELDRVQRLIPGVDEETAPPHPTRRRIADEAAPDIPPEQLMKKSGAGLRFLKARRAVVLLLALCAVYLALCDSFGLPLCGESFWGLRVFLSGWLLAGAVLLCADVLLKGLLRPGCEQLILLSCLASLADAFTMPVLGSRALSMPLCAVNITALFFLLWGAVARRRAMRLSCRVAASVRAPSLVTLDENRWDGADAYTRWDGPALGYGSQLQGRDGGQRVMALAAPLLMLSGVLLSMLSSLGRGKPELFLWCLSATLTAGCALAAPLVFSVPFSRIARRLAQSGAALGGWSGLSPAGKKILLTDLDLFPAKSIQLSTVRVFDPFTDREVAEAAASLAREGDLGLQRELHALLLSREFSYQKVLHLVRHEGGLEAVIQGRRVYLGTGAFMELMEIPLPEGLNLRTSAFCAIDGALAGIFLLDYRLHPSIPGALRALMKNGITPVLATRDFNILPATLYRKFKLPADKMEFPPAQRRAELSDPGQTHCVAITALLAREGMSPLAEAVVGGKRLRAVTLAGTVICLLGAVTGLLMAYYLTFSSAFAALTPLKLLFFLLAWCVPALLVGGLSNQY